MFNEQKLKQIQTLVNNATVLTAQEKTEWLALLELMNDKQLTELEEILQKPDIAKPLPTSSVPTNLPVGSPSLSHISNLPNRLSDQKQTKPLPPTGEVPMPTPKQMPTSTSMPPVSSYVAKPSASPEVKNVPMPEIKPLPIPKSSRASSAPFAAMVLNSLEDVPKLGISAVHQENREVFHKAINDFAAQYGYFKVITNFEQSPLYKDYLDYGKGMLSGKKDNLALSQEEFEFVTDILLSLKVNRF